MPGESIFLKVGASNLHAIRCEERTNIKIAREVLMKFYKLKGIDGSVDSATLSIFVEELLEELPPGNLVFPFSELNDWFERLKLNCVLISACM